MLESKISPQLTNNNNNNNNNNVSVWQYLEYMCANTSCHGGNWFSKIPSRKMQILFMLLIVTLQFATIVNFTFTVFINPDVTINTVTKYIPQENVTFPKVTICNPRMYSLKKTEGTYFIT
jgi:hypothetical protein